jgi:predicted GNAT family N-acyltransferase
MSQIKVIGAKWNKDRIVLKDIRKQVFILEQNVPQELEWDKDDAMNEHFLAYIDNEPVGCARLVDNKKIGRMAVLRPYRSMGVGKQIIDHIQRYASQKRYTRLELSAQCHAYSFYKQCGFEAFSLPYEDASIPHINMGFNVFSQQSNTGLFSMGDDSEIHRGQSQLQAQGLLDIILSQTHRSMILCLKDLSHPLCRHEGLIQKIKQLARHNRNFKVYILIGQHNTQNNEHNLFRLQDRLPSFIEIRSTQDSIPCKWLMDSTAWFDFELTNSRACFSDRAKIKHFMEQFNKWWHSAQNIADARRLSI